MIDASHRFHGHNSLTYVYRHGRVIRGPLTSLKYVQNSRRAQYRIAVVVSKKVSKKAVVRNRIRRRLYASLQNYLSGLTGGYDLVMTVFSDNIATIPPGEINKLVYAQLKQSGLCINQ